MIDTDVYIKEFKALQLAANGKTAQEIGSILNISPRTAETHIANVKRILDADSLAHAVAIALRKGIIK